MTDASTLTDWATFFEDVDADEQLSPDVIEYLRGHGYDSLARRLDGQRLRWLKKQVGRLDEHGV